MRKTRRHHLLILTPMEAAGLYALAIEGAEGLLTDKDAASGYIGDRRQVAAARRALAKLHHIATEARES